MASSANHSSSSSLRILEPELYKQRVKDMWQARAPTYDLHNTFHPKIVGMLLKVCSLAPRLCSIFTSMRALTGDETLPSLMQAANCTRGESVLDIGTGTGFAALQAAQLVGRTGRVVAVDICAAMLEQVSIGLSLDMTCSDYRHHCINGAF